VATEDKNYSLDILRAELGTAMANLKVDLIERFASKREHEELEKRLSTHEQENENRFRSVERFQNRVAGGLILGALFIPSVTTVLVKAFS
jgi:hypothetical protein